MLGFGLTYPVYVVVLWGPDSMNIIIKFVLQQLCVES